MQALGNLLKKGEMYMKKHVLAKKKKMATNGLNMDLSTQDWKHVKPAQHFRWTYNRRMAHQCVTDSPE